MAAGVPATGMGGIFYLLLSVIMVFYELVKRILSVLRKELKIEQKPAILTRIPTLAFVVCGVFLVYMNVTGFRFAIPGTQQASFSMNNLWILGVFSVGCFLFFMILFRFRARQTEGEN